MNMGLKSYDAVIRAVHESVIKRRTWIEDRLNNAHFKALPEKCRPLGFQPLPSSRRPPTPTYADSKGRRLRGTDSCLKISKPICADSQRWNFGGSKPKHSEKHKLTYIFMDYYLGGPSPAIVV